MLKKHLPHLLAHSSAPSDMGGPYTPIANAPTPMNALSAPPVIRTVGLQGKFEGTPIQSPAATTATIGTASWHSPGTAPSAHNTASPTASPLETGGYVGVNNSGQLVLTQAAGQRPGGFLATTMGPPVGGRPDLDDRPEKRQRLMDPQGTYVQ
jgi:hypothetical protein